MFIDSDMMSKKIIEEYVSNLPLLKIVKWYPSMTEAIEGLYTLRPDIVFVDLLTKDLFLSALETLKFLTENNFKIVIITSDPKFAIEGYQYNVIDYIIKPITFDRFLQAANKSIIKIKESYNLQSALINLSSIDKCFFTKEGKKTLQINSENIVFIESIKDYVKIYLLDRIVISYITISRLETILPSALFIRINRSYIVRFKAIKSIDGNIIEMNNKIQLNIGASYKDDVKAAVKSSFIGR